jgi:hypothetical protein
VEVKIAGVICRPLAVYADERGRLADILRQDEAAPDAPGRWTRFGLRTTLMPPCGWDDMQDGVGKAP